MALVVETGVGVAGATAFADLTTVDAWYASLGDATWAALNTTQRERAVILASLYVSNQQVYPYSGIKSFFGNALAWPRTGAVRWEGGGSIDPASVPPEVIHATIVAASFAARDALPTQIAARPVEQEIKRERVEGAVTVDYYHSTEGKFTLQDTVIGQPAIAALGLADINGILFPLLREDALDPRSTAVSRSRAARRGARLEPSDSPAAFGRGMFDARPLAEDRKYTGRGGD